MTEKATPRPWRTRIDLDFGERLVIEGEFSEGARNPSHSYVVCNDKMPSRRERAIADYDLIVKAVNQDSHFDEVVTALETLLG